jgi:hypothetical protein
MSVTSIILANLALSAGALGALALVMSLPKQLQHSVAPRSQETHRNLRRDAQPLAPLFEV